MRFLLILSATNIGGISLCFLLIIFIIHLLNIPIQVTLFLTQQIYPSKPNRISFLIIQFFDALNLTYSFVFFLIKKITKK